MSTAASSSGAAPKISSVRLLATMGATGAVAGLLVVLAYTSTTPIILANRTAAIDTAIHEVLPRIDHYERLYVHDGALTANAPAEEAGGHEPEMVYAGYDTAGTLVGFAITAREPGFQDPIELLFGFDPLTQTTLGLTILSSRETPGLGDKIQREEWRAQFRGAKAPVQPRKRGVTDPDAVQMVTGATISSRAVVGAINKGITRWGPMLTAYLQEPRS
jgi:electron transport complex protein RnfG